MPWNVSGVWSLSFAFAVLINILGSQTFMIDVTSEQANFSGDTLFARMR
jgi:hypothetical protein